MKKTSDAVEIIDILFGGDPEYDKMLAEEQTLLDQEIAQRKIEFEKSSGNIFADLNFADAEAMHQKANLTQVIREKIRARSLTLSDAAQLVGTGISTMTDIYNWRIGAISHETLFSIAEQLVLA